MIKLALEIPTVYLDVFTYITDLDFVLAHRVLEDEAYARWFERRPDGRELILDNSVHELGHPMSGEDLGKAAARCRADRVIAPDCLGEPGQNVSWFAETVESLGGFYDVTGVLCGRNPTERHSILNIFAANSKMLCLPFREPRLEWFREQEDVIVRNFTHVHLLGVSTLEELWEFSKVAERHLKTVFSVDTAKPFKAALEGRRLDDGTSLRGLPTSSKDLLGLSDLSDETLALVHKNIEILRTYL
jgi:hypothetical protein